MEPQIFFAIGVLVTPALIYLLYFIVREAVHEGVLSALKEYDKLRNVEEYNK